MYFMFNRLQYTRFLPRNVVFYVPGKSKRAAIAKMARLMSSPAERIKPATVTRVYTIERVNKVQYERARTTLAQCRATGEKLGIWW